MTGVNDVLEGLRDLIENRARDLEAQQVAYTNLKSQANQAIAAREISGREVEKARGDLRTVCFSYLALIEGKTLMNDNPCRPYVYEYERMVAKGSEVDRT